MDLEEILDQADELFKEWKKLSVDKCSLENSVMLYTKALEIDPLNTTALNGRGIALLDLKKYEEAFSDFNKAVELKPDEGFFYLNRGIALMHLGKPEALADMTYAIVNLKCHHPIAYRERGILLLDLGRFQEALADLNKSVELNHDDSVTLVYRAQVFENLNLFEEALNDYDSIVQLNKNEPGAFTSRGDLQMILGRFGDALSDFNHAISLNPNKLCAYHLRSRVLVRLGMFSDAVSDCIVSIKAENHHADYMIRAQAFNGLGRYQEALSDIEKAKELGCTHFSLFSILGNTYRLMGEEKLAEENYRKAIQLFNEIKEKYHYDYMQAISAERGLRKLGISSERQIENEAIAKKVFSLSHVERIFKFEK